MAEGGIYTTGTFGRSLVRQQEQRDQDAQFRATAGRLGIDLPDLSTPAVGAGASYPAFGARAGGVRNRGRVGGKGGGPTYQPPRQISSGYGDNMGMASGGKGGRPQYGGKGGGQRFGGVPYKGGKRGGMARQQMGGRGFPQQGKGGGMGGGLASAAISQGPASLGPQYGGYAGFPNRQAQQQAQMGGKGGGLGGQMMRQPYGGSPYGGKGQQGPYSAMNSRTFQQQNPYGGKGMQRPQYGGKGQQMGGKGRRY